MKKQFISQHTKSIILPLVKNLSRQCLLLIILLISVDKISAQYVKIKDFLSESGNNLGIPYGDLISDGNYLYGMTGEGGNYGSGTVFKVHPDGSGFQKLFDFDGDSLGSSPTGTLLLSGSVLYGITDYGGEYDYGIIFKISTNGSEFKKIHDFGAAGDGKGPKGSLVLSGQQLYGVTEWGGVNEYGCIFSINTDGTYYQKIHDFAGGANGYNPTGPLTMVDDTLLYGVTAYGGTNGWGIIYKININKTGFQKIYDLYTETNGGEARSPLVLYNNMLYGMTRQGGTSWQGCIFSFLKNGTGFQKVYNFNATSGNYPEGSLLLSNDTIFGLTNRGGTEDNGTIFKVHINGTGFQKLSDFTSSYSNGSLAMVNSQLYGMEIFSVGYGEVVKISIFKINTNGTGFTAIKDLNSCPEGDSPKGIIRDGQVIYGYTHSGGLNNNGLIYKMNPDATGYQKLFEFGDIEMGKGINGSLLLSDDVFYGTTVYGGINGYGVIFRVNADGTGFQKLHDFTLEEVDEDGSPSSLIISGHTLFGSTGGGGSFESGIVYKIHTDGMGFQAIHTFNGNDGYYPNRLSISGTLIYGTTMYGGINDKGTAFRIDTSGTGFQKLFDLDGANGSYPSGTLILADTVLYGTAQGGGDNDAGTLFKIHSDGTGFQKLHDFYKEDGNNPTSLQLIDGTTLYGITSNGGIYNTIDNSGLGTFFKIGINGSDFEKLHDFDGINTGRYPTSLIQYNNLLYGTCSSGGAENLGTVFKYYLVPSALSVSPGTLNLVKSASNNKSVTITSNDDWTAVSSQSWLTLSKASGYGNGTITLTASANPGAAERTATITVSGEWITQTITVNQTEDVTLLLDESSDRIAFYPNPCSDRLTIDLAQNLLQAVVSIYSVQGEKLLQQEINNSALLDMTTFKPGMYIVRIQTPAKTLEKKILKF